jgi:triacylglycerol lipase
MPQVTTELTTERAAFDAEIASLGRTLGPELATATHEALQKHCYVQGSVQVARDRVYGQHARHRMDVFTGADVEGPVLVFVHGGGFVRGDKHKSGRWYYDNVGHWAAGAGMVGVTINYRLAPEAQWPAGAEDVSAAVNHLVAEGTDPARVVLMGHSTGATHVASYLAGQAGTVPAVGAAVLVSGAYDLRVGEPSPAYYGDDVLQHMDRSPIPGLTRTEVPLLFAVAEYDTRRIERHLLSALDARLTAGHGPPHLVRVSGHNHYSIVWHIGGPDTRFTTVLADFINKSIEGRKGRPENV